MKFNKETGLYKMVSDVNSLFIVGDHFSFTFDLFEIKNLRSSFSWTSFIDTKSYGSPLLRIIRGQ